MFTLRIGQYYLLKRCEVRSGLSLLTSDNVDTHFR